MDEQPVQLLSETRVPIPATAKHAERVDYEYERTGTASIFMFAEPLSGFRKRRPAATNQGRLGHRSRPIAGRRYAACAKVIVVCDNLNTHTKGAFYEAFPPERARDLVRRIDFCYTPKHGSWLNIAECELSSLTRQCVIGPPIRRHRTLCEGNRRLVHRHQRQATRRRLAIQDRRRQNETEVGLPEN